MAANRHRGEIETIIDGVPYRLCLTLGALAELEAALGAGDLIALARRFESGSLSARDILALLTCGLRGGGREITESDVATMVFPGGLPGAIKIAVDLVSVTFGTPQIGEPTTNPPQPQGA